MNPCLPLRLPFAISLLLISAVSAEPNPELKPLLAQPDQIILENDFSSPDQLTRNHWAARQGTRWSVADGVLRGLPSTPEYQASKKDHKGFEPRISSPVTPAQCVARFSVRFTGGGETGVVPFVEFGHHVARVKFSRDGISLLADHDTLKIAETTAVRFEPGRWYHCLAELKGEEFVFQIAGGPTLHARHRSYALAPASGAPGMGVAGPKDGTAEIDDVTFWSILPDPQPGWATAREALPKFEPVPVNAKEDR